MKVTTLLFSALLFSKAALAQTGTLLVYGNLDIASSKASTGVKSNAFSLSPGVGYQFNDHWTAGANLPLSSTLPGLCAKTKVADEKLHNKKANTTGDCARIEQRSDLRIMMRR
ncbi:hypothetical protein ACN9ML_11680 [Dyadobacter endophyticus]|uniref:Outer membrane protein beta-barrel domain-containing protein n=1 Tax=Dyadobacter endophyticus TaxID=1749036 RepID=A0ABQ1YR18_9BACT|nr:hypothetical protein [Dyadobacter endophyticus]GGH33512.1 hypothetical protein GCM10007423_23840 [Dyadobacter endophyticus]